MSVPELSADASAERAGIAWRIRIRSWEPTLIDDEEIVYGIVDKALARTYTLVSRTSYMVTGPNREVYWAIDTWDRKTRDWSQIVDGKSRLKKGSQPG